MDAEFRLWPGLTRLIDESLKDIPLHPEYRSEDVQKELRSTAAWCFIRGWTVDETRSYIRYTEYVTGSDADSIREDVCLRQMEQIADAATERVDVEYDLLSELGWKIRAR